MRTVNGTVAAARNATSVRDISPAGRHRAGRPDLHVARSPHRSPVVRDRDRDREANRETEMARRVNAQRQNLAGALHDEIGPLLFAIAATTQRAQVLHGDDAVELRRVVDEVSDRVAVASDLLRELLSAAAPVDDGEAVPTAVERDLSDLRERTDTVTRLVVRGRTRRLAPRVERTLLQCLRQALFNIERHADASGVVVTLDYAPDVVRLVVDDDGRGVDPGLALAGLPEGARRWGFASMTRQVEQNGGEITLERRDGGTSLCVRLPV